MCFAFPSRVFIEGPWDHVRCVVSIRGHFRGKSSKKNTLKDYLLFISDTSSRLAIAFHLDSICVLNEAHAFLLLLLPFPWPTFAVAGSRRARKVSLRTRIIYKKSNVNKERNERYNGNDDTHRTTANAHAMVGNDILAWCEFTSYFLK